MVGLLAAISYIVATRFGQGALPRVNPHENLYLALYWGLVILHVLLRLFALNGTVGGIAAEKQFGTWETLKVTTDGALLTLRARWSMVFYRLGLLLTIITVARLVFIGVALFNLVSIQGHYLDNMLSGTTPLGQPSLMDSSILSGVLILAMMFTAALIAPFTAVAFDAALGTLIGTFTRGRIGGLLGQLFLMLLRVAIVAWALWVGAAALSLSPFPELLASLNPSGGASSLMGVLGAFFGIAEGDLGLTALHLPHVQRMWADYDNGVFIGVAFLGYVLLQALLANLIMAWAGRRAIRAEKG